MGFARAQPILRTSQCQFTVSSGRHPEVSGKAIHPCDQAAGRADDLVGAPSFLTSDDTAFMIGQTLNVDEGG
jgi:hypothetical protein